MNNEERRQVEYKDELARLLQPFFPCSVNQVIAIGPMLVYAMTLLKKRYAQSDKSSFNQHSHLQESYISEQRTKMLRFIQFNFDIFVNHFQSVKLQ